MKHLQILKISLETVLSATIFVVIPIIAFTIVTSKTSAFFGYQSFTVLSGSMSPLIPTGSIVYTQKTREVLPGDIITFKRGDKNITHRIIAVVDKDGKSVSPFVSPLSGKQSGEIFYKVKGDANNAPDSELVAQKDLVGKAYIHLPAIGRFASFVRSVPGFLMFVVFPTLLFVGFELWNVKKEIEKEVEKKTIERMRAA